MNEFPSSKAPRFEFAETLEEQENQLRRNPLLQRMREARREKADDPHRSLYHYVNPEYALNDPNGLCFWQGRWHLFYQARPPEDPATALGPRRQPGPHPLAGPSVCHWSRTGGQVLLRHHPGGGGPGDRHVPRRGSREHGGRFPRPSAVELAEGDGPPSHTVRVRGRAAPAVRGLRSLHLEEGRCVLRPLRGDRALPPGGQACGRQLPVPLAGPRELGVPAPVLGGGSVHAAGRRRRLPLLLAPRRPAHPGVLQSPERWSVPDR